MTSTLWFWIVVLLLLLIVVWLIKKYLGRFLLICLFLCILFFVYKWIFPNGAAALTHWIQSVPVQVTNYFNRSILKNNIELGADISSAVSQQKESISEISLSKGEQVTVVEPKSEEKKESWFRRLFKKKTEPKNEVQLSSGSLASQEIVLKDEVLASSWAAKVELSWETIVAQTGVLVKEVLLWTWKVWSVEVEVNSGILFPSKTGKVEILEEQEDMQEDIEEVYYLPSNPKPSSSPKKTTFSSSLSAEDLREAREIFWN